MENYSAIATLMVARMEDYSSVLVGKGSQLNNHRLKVPVILAKEMVQHYHKSEFPSFIQDQFPEGSEFIPVLKPYEELKKAIVGIEKLPINLDHHWVDDPLSDVGIVGHVQDLKACDERRLIHGVAYIDSRKLSPSLVNRIKTGLIVDVSIGGSTMFSGGGVFDGKKYVLKQINLKLNHLASLEHDPGRCPAGICGLNMDSAKNISGDLSAILKDGKSGKIMTTSFQFFTDIDQVSSAIMEKLTTIRPIYGSDSTINKKYESEKITKKKVKLMEEKDILKLQQNFADAQQELATIRDKQSTEASHEVTKLSTQLAEVNDQIKIKDAQIEKLEADIKIKDGKLDKIDADKKAALVSKLFMVRDAKNEPRYKKADLEAKSLETLEIMDETLDSFKDQAPAPAGGFKKPAQKGESNMNDQDKSSVGNAVVNMNDLFKSES